MSNLVKLSEETLQTLKNFASINPNFVAKGGKQVSTIAEAKNIIANATVDIDLPKSFAIYDLNEFLSVLGLVDEPHIDFGEGDTHATISDSTGRSTVTYYYSDPSILTKSSKEIVMPESEIKFDLDSTTLQRIKRASSALGHDLVRITGDGGSIVLTVTDKDNSTSNEFSITVPGSSSIDNPNFEVYMIISNMKFVAGNYSVEISSKNISRFVKEGSGHEYFVAVEKSSKF